MLQTYVKLKITVVAKNCQLVHTILAIYCYNCKSQYKIDKKIQN